MLLSFSPQARADLLEIGDFIAQDNPVRALSFVEEIEEKCAGLLGFPKMGKARRELSSGLRSLFWESYVVLYAV